MSFVANEMNICRRKHLFRKRRSAHLLLPRECTCAVEIQFCINKCIVAAGKIGWSFCSDSKINLRQHKCLSILQWERSVAKRKGGKEAGGGGGGGEKESFEANDVVWERNLHSDYSITFKSLFRSHSSGNAVHGGTGDLSLPLILLSHTQNSFFQTVPLRWK